MKHLLFLPLALIWSCISHGQGLSKDSLDLVTSATVYIKVEADADFMGLASAGSGSGFFVHENGYIATNYHVIQPLIPVYSIAYPVKTNKITVIRHSGRKDYTSYDAVICAIDRDYDLAILKIEDSTKTPALPLHGADDLLETSEVRVFGYPFGEEFAVIQRGPEITVTRGEITALRHNDKDELATIQVDAVVNPGNSGGPCVNNHGEVIGIINMKGGETMQNFGIPVHFLQRLMASVPMSNQLKTSYGVKFTCSPLSATVFVDPFVNGSPSGSAMMISPGHHTFCVMQNGFEPMVVETPVYSDTTIAVRLKPQAPISLNAVVGRTTQLTDVACEKKSGEKELMTEQFSHEQNFLTWEQSTGGMGERTWFLEKGTLRQFEADGLLHSISMGDTSWTDYVVSTRMKIEGLEGDPRAGIIFRENWRGFYLFRIHRETNKAQLVYHSKHPFGWVILMEKELSDIDDQWHDLSVVVHGSEVSCFLDDNCVFKALAGFSPAGRIGFYSVESQPSFDSLSVTALQTGSRGPQGQNPEVISYWFTDHFGMSEEAWYTYRNTPTSPFPWTFSDLGRMMAASETETFVAEFTRYSLNDFDLSMIVTLGDSENAVFDLVFGRKISGEYLLRFSKAAGEIQLIHRSGGVEKLLKKSDMSPEFFGYVNRLNLLVSEGKLMFASSQGDALEYSGKKLINYSGRLALSLQSGQVVVHEMNGTSVVKE